MTYFPTKPVFSYNNDIRHKLNFGIIEEKLNSVLNLWSGRNLTLFGRTQICKSLALPKVLYVTNMCLPPKSFITNVAACLKKVFMERKTP